MSWPEARGAPGRRRQHAQPDRRRRLHARRVRNPAHERRAAERAQVQEPANGTGREESFLAPDPARTRCALRVPEGPRRALAITEAYPQILTRLSGGKYSFCPGWTLKAGYQASMLRTVSAL